jgi:hypothetical protein
MFEDVTGRLISGALWGLGAGIVLSVMRGEDRSRRGLRPVARTLVKGYVVASDRVRELTAEARESLGDLYAEAKAEQHSPNGHAPAKETRGPDTASRTSRPRRSRARSASEPAAEA